MFWVVACYALSLSPELFYFHYFFFNLHGSDIFIRQGPYKCHDHVYKPNTFKSVHKITEFLHFSREFYTFMGMFMETDSSVMSYIQGVSVLSRLIENLN
jgi:hypothetical protein